MSDKPDEKPQEPSYQNYLSALMEFLAARPNSNVLVIVESPRGFETYSTMSSPVWNKGAAGAAESQFDEILRMMLRASSPEKERLQKEEQDRMDESLKRDKERTN